MTSLGPLLVFDAFVVVVRRKAAAYRPVVVPKNVVSKIVDVSWAFFVFVLVLGV
jgi:hypothetical protein